MRNTPTKKRRRKIATKEARGVNVHLGRSAGIGFEVPVDREHGSEIGPGRAACIVPSGKLGTARGDNTRLFYGNNLARVNHVIGVVSALKKGEDGDVAVVVGSGPCLGVLENAAPCAPYYLSGNGDLVTGRPKKRGDLIIRVGVAMNATDLWVQVQDLGTVV